MTPTFSDDVSQPTLGGRLERSFTLLVRCRVPLAIAQLGNGNNQNQLIRSKFQMSFNKHMMRLQVSTVYVILIVSMSFRCLLSYIGNDWIGLKCKFFHFFRMCRSQIKLNLNSILYLLKS